MRSTWPGFPKCSEQADAKRLIVMGDFNQAIGQGSRAPRALRLALQEAFESEAADRDGGSCLPGAQEHRPHRTECGLGGRVPRWRSANIHGEKKLSDHFGVAADVSVRPLG